MESKTKSFTAYDLTSASNKASDQSLTSTKWECVVEEGQMFLPQGENIIFEVLEVRPSTLSKWDADVYLSPIVKSTGIKRQISAATLCGGSIWRRLPDLELNETYLVDEGINSFDDPFSAPTRIGLGPTFDIKR